jgi:hypothetical protein
LSTGDIGGQPPPWSPFSAQRVKAFQGYLNGDKNATCRQKLAGLDKNIISEMSNVAGTARIYNTDLLSGDQAQLYIYTSMQNWNALNKGITIGQVFSPKGFPVGPGNIEIIHVVTEPLSTQYGQAGIYTPGGVNSASFQGPNGDANLEHEFTHYVTGLGDKELIKQLGIKDNDINGWFQRGCKNQDGS